MFLGVDAHKLHCVLAGTDVWGMLLFCTQLPTSEAALISRSVPKDDFEDAFNLRRLLWLGELKDVYHAGKDCRVIFKYAVQH